MGLEQITERRSASRTHHPNQEIDILLEDKGTGLLGRIAKPFAIHFGQ
jgi:hypothetical protein